MKWNLDTLVPSKEGVLQVPDIMNTNVIDNRVPPTEVQCRWYEPDMSEKVAIANAMDLALTIVRQAEEKKSSCTAF